MSERKLVFIGNPWASSEIRGRQVAERLGRRFVAHDSDPDTSINTKDVLVVIKAAIQNPERFERIFVDVVDGYGVIPFYSGLSNVTFIAISEMAKKFIENRGCENVVVIPEHHCNFERKIRLEKEVKTVGFIGYPERFGLDVELLAKAMLGCGFRYLHVDSFKSREDICRFYERIDIQITFGDSKTTINLQMPPELKNPLKLENAGSYKIPTVGYPEPNYMEEFANCFLPAYDLQEVVGLCCALRNDAFLYSTYAERAFKKARRYHIDEIIKCYRRLEENG